MHIHSHTALLMWYVHTYTVPTAVALLTKLQVIVWGVLLNLLHALLMFPLDDAVS